MKEIEYCLSEKVMDNADCLNRVFKDIDIPIKMDEKPIIEMFGYFEDEVKPNDDACDWMDEKYRWYIEENIFLNTEHIDEFLQNSCIPYLYHGTTKQKLEKMVDKDFNAIIIPSKICDLS